MSAVYIVGVGMTPLGKHLDQSVKQLTARAVNAALADAGCNAGSIESAWFSNTRQGVMEGQNGIRGQCALRAMGFESIPIINCDNACASSTTGFNQAVASIKAGFCEVALVVGTEKMNYPDKRDLMFQAFTGGWDRDIAEAQMAALIARAKELPLPPQAALPAAQRSVFMDVYAAKARLHMKAFGTTQRQLAAVAAKNHHHSSFNPLAQYQQSMTIDEVLADKLISWPLTRSMCAPMSDGAGAVVLSAASALARFDRKRAVRVLATTLGSGTNRDAEDWRHHVVRLVADKAYAQAGVGPDDISVAEIHDASAFAELAHTENLCFCGLGAGGAMAERGESTLGGRLPVNTSGGLLSKGHPIAATGAIQLHELVAQLRGEAGRRQVPGARIALAENGGGFYHVEEAVAAVTILIRD